MGICSRAHALTLTHGASLLLAALLTVGSAAAQSSLSSMITCTTSINGHELSFDLQDDNNETATLTLYNTAGQALVPIGATSATVAFSYRQDDCDLLVDFPPYGAIPDPARNVVRYAAFSGFVTVELTGLSLGQPISRRLLYGNGRTAAHCDGGVGHSFLCPNTVGRIGDEDAYIRFEATDLADQPRDYNLRVSPTQAWNTPGGPHFIDETIADDGWIFPYHAPTFCAGGRCNIASTSRSGMVLMPVDGVVVRGQPFVKQVTGSVPTTLQAGLTYDWVEDWLTLAFRPGGRLDIASTSADVTGMTFTAAVPSWGWYGVRFLPGWDGTWDGATVERVTGPNEVGLLNPVPTRAVSVTDASPTFTDLTVRFPMAGTGPVDGVYVSGATSHVVLTEPTIQGMSGTGVTANGGARVDVARGTLTGSSGGPAVKAGGSGSVVYLVPASGGSNIVGPQITFNPGGGVLAASSGAVRFGAPSPAAGLATVANNGGRGLSATGSGVIYAGTATVYQRNRVFLNAPNNPTGNARASGGSSRVYARCNWWNQEVAPFCTGAVSGGLVDVSAPLLLDPYSNPTAPCSIIVGGSSGSRSAGGVGAAAFRGDGEASLLDRLAEAVEAQTSTEAVTLLAALVADAPEAPEAAAALAEAGGIAGRADAPASAVALLDDATASARRPLRVAAWQGLVSARRAHGDRTGALAATDALAAEGGGAVVQAELARVYLHGEASDSTAAWAALARLEALAPDGIEAGLARAFLDGTEAPDEARHGAAPLVESSATAASSDERMSLAVGPNPSAGEAVLRLSLPASADVLVIVYDLLGRAVAMPLAGSLAAGEHLATVAASGLAPGVYVVRASATTATGVVLATARLTVVR